MNKKGTYAAFLTGLAVIGGGTYTIADRLTGDGAEKTDTALSGPAKQPSIAGPVMPDATAASAAPDAGTSPAPGPTISLGAEAMQRLTAAKKAGENDIKAQRAIPQPAVTAPLQRWEEGSLRKNGKMLRVVSAAQDLTGYKELAWVADEGEKVGSSRCSQTLKMSNEQEPRVRPTIVICWRLSPERSVYSLLIDLKKKPSMRESVAKIDKVWARMG